MSTGDQITLMIDKDVVNKMESLGKYARELSNTCDLSGDELRNRTIKDLAQAIQNTARSLTEVPMVRLQKIQASVLQNNCDRLATCSRI